MESLNEFFVPIYIALRSGVKIFARLPKSSRIQMRVNTKISREKFVKHTNVCVVVARGKNIFLNKHTMGACYTLFALNYGINFYMLCE